MPQLIAPYRFIAHSPASALQMNANFAAVADLYNGNLGADNLADNAITSGKLTADTILSNNFGDNSVTAAKIVDDTVVWSNINNDQLTGTHFWPVAAASNFPAYRVPQSSSYWPTLLPGTISGVTFPAHSAGTDYIYLITDIIPFSSILDSGISSFDAPPEIHSVEIIPDNLAAFNWKYCAWTFELLLISPTGMRLKFHGLPTGEGWYYNWVTTQADIDITLIWYQQPLPSEL